MKKKSEFTILERAMQTVEGFDKLFHKMLQQTILGGRSQSKLEIILRGKPWPFWYFTVFRKIFLKTRSMIT